MRNNYYFKDVGGEFIFEYEVPGLSKEDIQVSSENNYINIVVNDKRHGEENMNIHLRFLTLLKHV